MIRQLAKIYLAVAACLCSFHLCAQSNDSIIARISAIHQAIKKQPCSTGQVISNRGMNLFLADRIGYYLSSNKDLTFYKNNITFNAATGIFSLTHNLFQARGQDEPVGGFTAVGIKTNAANAFAAGFSNRAFTNELGITIKKVWISKPLTVTNSCFEKNYMDIYREQQLMALAAAIKEKYSTYSKSVQAVENKNIADSIFTKAKQEQLASFNKSLEQEYYRLFAEQQYRELAATEKFKSIKLHWTSFTAYLPIVMQRYVVAGSLSSAIANKKNYPAELWLSHSRFWETKKYGRLLLTLEAAALLNNTINSHESKPLSFPEYKNEGGADTIALRQRKINSIYIGDFANFITPALTFSFVYFPLESHIGFSGSLTQNFGKYKALNLMLGIPVVLIDKTTAPAINFELGVHYNDLSNTIFPGRNFEDKLSVQVTVGVPFSKIIY